jgi:hypothetical protein
MEERAVERLEAKSPEEAIVGLRKASALSREKSGL